MTTPRVTRDNGLNGLLVGVLFEAYNPHVGTVSAYSVGQYRDAGLGHAGLTLIFGTTEIGYCKS